MNAHSRASALAQCAAMHVHLHTPVHPDPRQIKPRHANLVKPKSNLRPSLMSAKAIVQLSQLSVLTISLAVCGHGLPERVLLIIRDLGPIWAGRGLCPEAARAATAQRLAR